MSPFSLLVYEAHPVLLAMLVRYIQERHSKSLAVTGATFREAEALALAATTSPQVVLLGRRGTMQDADALIAAMRRLLPSGILVGMGQLGTAGYESAALAAGVDVFVDHADLKTALVPAIVRIARIRGIVS